MLKLLYFEEMVKNCDTFISYFRGRGPLKSTMDVINAAKKISEAGTKLDALANKIAEQVGCTLIISKC